MALGGGGGRRTCAGPRRARKRPLSEINVTPLVDVMLVLLIIFMISAPLLTVGVPVELPKTEASAVDDRQRAGHRLDRQGRRHLRRARARSPGTPDRRASARGGRGRDAREKPIFVRADGRAPYQAVARVMARLSAAGFTKLNLITDTGARAGG